MKDQVWAAIRTLVENKGITFNDCLGLALQVLNLLPQIPIDVSFQTQIPLTSTYCQNPLFTGDGTQSKVVFDLFARKSGHLALCPRCCMGSPTNQVRAWIIPHLQLLQTTLWGQAAHGAPEINHITMPEVSPQSVAHSLSP